MAIKKSQYTGGAARQQMHAPFVARSPAAEILTYVFTEDVAAGDIIDLAPLPAYCRPVSAELVSVGTGAVTFDVGFVTGTPGDTDDARTMGTELLAAALPTTAKEVPILTLAELGSTDSDRSIGIRPSAAIPADEAVKVFLRLTYIRGAR